MGFEPMNTGFADQRVNHFATGAHKPRRFSSWSFVTRPENKNPTTLVAGGSRFSSILSVGFLAYRDARVALLSQQHRQHAEIERFTMKILPRAQRCEY